MGGERHMAMRLAERIHIARHGRRAERSRALREHDASAARAAASRRARCGRMAARDAPRRHAKARCLSSCASGHGWPPRRTSVLSHQLARLYTGGIEAGVSDYGRMRELG